MCFDNYINRHRNENYYDERRADTAAGIFPYNGFATKNALAGLGTLTPET
jgi:hypothetical protein